MQLNEIGDLSAAAEEADREGLTPTEKSDFLNFRANLLKEAAQADFSGADGYEVEQGTIANIDKDLRAKQDVVSAQLLNGVLDTHFADDREGRHAFVNELRRNGGDTSEYSPQWKSIVADMEEELSTVSKPELGFARSQFRDAQGNVLADSFVTSNNKGHPLEAKVMFNKVTGDPKLGGAKGVASAGGDTIRFPENFDPVETHLANLEKELAAKQISVTETQTYLDANKADAVADEETMAGYDAQTENLNKTQDEIDAINTEIAAINEAKKSGKQSNAYAKAWQSGIDSYLDTEIKARKASGNPRYNDVGVGTWESLQREVTNFVPSVMGNLGAFGLAGVEALTDAIDSIPGIEADPIGRERLEFLIQENAAANKARNDVGRFSEMAITNPTAAHLMMGASDTLSSVAQTALTTALSPGVGLTVMGATAGGAEFSNLVNYENELRSQGKIEEADHIRSVRALSSVGTAGIEGLSENIFPYHNILRKGMTKMTLGTIAKEAIKEGPGEEVVAGLGNAYKDLEMGIINDDQFVEQLATLPEKAGWGMFGSIIQTGARKAVIDYRRGEALKLVRAARDKQSTSRLSFEAAIEDVAREEETKAKAEQAAFEEKVEHDLGDIGGMDSYMSDKSEISVTEDDEAIDTTDDLEQSKPELIATNRVPLNPTVEPVVESNENEVVSQATAPVYSESYKRSYNHAFNMIYGMFIDQLHDIRKFKKEFGPEMAKQLAIYASATPDGGVQMSDDSIFHLIVDDMPTATEYNYSEFFENRGAMTLNDRIKNTKRFKDAKTDDERKMIFDKMMATEQALPMFRALPEVFYSNNYGKFAIDTVDGIEAKIASGELDPSKHWFYDHTEKGAARLWKLVGDDRVAASDYGTVGVTVDDEGNPRQNKIVEQEWLQGSKFHIPSKSVTDILSEDEIVTALRVGPDERGDATTHVQALTDAAKQKLFDELDRIYPGGWVGKRVGGMAQGGMIHRSYPGSRESATIGVEENNQYIFQPELPIRHEYRVTVFLDQSGKAVPIGGFFKKDFTTRDGWKRYGATVMTPQEFSDVKEVIDFINQKGFNGDKNTVYGIDIFKLEDGSLKITELNPKDYFGQPGSVSLYASGYRGIEAAMRGKHSMEAMVGRAALLYEEGSKRAARRMLYEANKQGGGVIPDAAALRQRGSMFYGEKIDGVSPANVSPFLAGFDIPLVKNRNASLKDIKYDVRQLLSDMVAAGNAYSAVAADLLRVADKAGNPGLNAAVVRVNTNDMPEYIHSIFKQRPRVVLTSDTTTFNFALHEASHALSRNAIPYDLSVYAYKNITGEQYLKRLNNYLKNGKNDSLKRVILDYITAVEGLGLSDDIFGKRQIKTGSDNTSPIYALSSLDEFVAEVYVGRNLRQLLNSFNHDAAKESILKRLISKVVDFIKTSLFGDPTKHATFFDRAYQNALVLANYNYVTESEWDRQMLSTERYSNNFELSNLRKEAAMYEKLASPTKVQLSQLSKINKRIVQLAPNQSMMYSIGTKTQLVLDRTHPNFREWQRIALKSGGPSIRFDGTQRFFASETSNEIVPVYDSYTILHPGEKVNGASFNVPHGASDKEVNEMAKQKYAQFGTEYQKDAASVTEEVTLPIIRKPASGPPKTTSISYNGYSFDKRYMTRQQRADLDNALLNPMKLPSREIDKILSRLSKAAGKAEYRVLKRLYREPFKGFKYTNIRDAKIHLVDWLMENPDDKGGIPASLRAKTRTQQARTLRYLKQKASDGITSGKLSAFISLSPEIQERVRGVIDHINNTTNAANMTNRQMMGLNLALKIFTDSNGEDVRGFAKIAEKIDVAEKINPVDAEKKRLNDMGIVHVFGDAISDWRRGHMRGSKTGTGVADKSTEMDAIFNREGTWKSWVKMIHKFMVGISNFKYNHEQIEEKYTDMLRGFGSTNQLEDARISIAKLATQYEINPDKDPVKQLVKIMNEIDTSISRMERSTRSRDRDKGKIQRVAFDQIILPVQHQIAVAGPIGINEDDIIDGIEAALNDKEMNILKAIREPGQQFWHQLNSIHQITRGEPVDRIHNFAHRSQYSLNPETDVVHWQKRSTEAADPILKPRQGLGADDSAVFNMDWRSDFSEHLKQAMFELHTGVERVFLHRALDSHRFGQIMDDDASTRTRSKRLIAQVGTIVSNIKNPQIQYSSFQRVMIQAMQFTNWIKLVSGKGAANQMIPMAAVFVKYPEAITKIALGRLPIIGSGRKVLDNFTQKHNPDLYKRLSHFDQIIEPVKGQQGLYKQTGLPGISAARSAFEQAREAASVFGSYSTRIAGWLARLPVVVTNGLTESFSAKTAFMAIYASKLEQAGKLPGGIESIFRSVPFDAQLFAEAELEIDQFVLSPISPEMRGDFWQKNSVGKAYVRDSLFALSRTSIQQAVRAGTAWRDYIAATKEVAQYGTAESREYQERALNKAIVQSMQLAAYQAVNAMHLALSVSIAQTGFFLADAIMEGDDPDREKWMRRMRILEKAEIDQSARFMLFQGMMDVLLQFMPVSPILSSNVGRGFGADIMKHMFDLGVDIPTLEAELESVREEIGKYDKYFTNLQLLNQPSTYTRASEAREAMEYTAEMLSRKIANKKNWVSSTGADIANNMQPFGTYIDKQSRDVPQTVDWVYDFLIGHDNTKAMKNKMIDEGKSSEFYWWMSYLLNAAPPVRKASKSVLTERATSEVEKIQTAEKHDKENLELLNQR